MRTWLLVILALSVVGIATAGFRITPTKGSAVLLRSHRDLDWKPAMHLAPGAQYHLLREDPQNHGIQTLVRFPKRYTVPEHTHTGDETLLVLKGKIEVRAGTAVRVLHPGDYAVLPKGVPHTLRSVGWSGARFFTVMSAPYDINFVKPHSPAPTPE
jgi:quercetin dioxygenase-like cupin family protein